MPAIASPAAATGQVGLGRDRDPAAGQALADVVVGLADEASARRPGPENAPNDWPAAPRSSRRTGPRSSPRSRAPVRPAPNERSAVVSRRPPTVTGPWSRNAAAMRVSSGDAGAWRAVRAGSSGSARRAASAPHDDGADDRRELRPGRRDRPQQPPALADDLADGPGTDRRQLAAQVLGDGEEEPLDHLGRAGELGPQVLALGGDAGRAGVEVALARHVAADRHERRGPERELLGAQQRRHEQVATGLQAAVGAQRDAVAQVVAQQDLVDLGEAQLPRRADVLDRAAAATRPSRRRARRGGCTWRRPWPRRRRPCRRPRLATSLTPIRAVGLIARRSAMSWARSSIE